MFSLSFSQELEKETKKKIEKKELEKELNNKAAKLNEVKKLILENKIFKQEKESQKSQKEQDKQQFNFLKAKAVDFPLQELTKIIDDIGESDESPKLPDSETDDENDGEVFQNLTSDNTRLRGYSQFDSRIEVRELDASIDWQWLMLQRNKSVGIVIEKKQLKLISKNIFQLDISNTLVSTYNICKEEPFINQPIIGNGTAFIIDSKIMMTAGHVFTKPIDNYAVVFGYEAVNKNGVVESIISSEDIYYPQTIIKSFKTLDIAIFTMDRHIENRRPLKWKESADLKKGNEVYMIGHPTGLPKKIAVNASIVDNTNLEYFYTTLDSFQGNSGSPVFDFISHKVIGVLVSGELDYEFNGNCYESTLCKIPYCDGEKVIRIETVMEELNFKSD